MLNGISQTKKNKYFIGSFIGGILFLKAVFIETENRKVVARAQGGAGIKFGKSIQTFNEKINKVQDLMHNMDTVDKMVMYNWNLLEEQKKGKCKNERKQKVESRVEWQRYA